MTRRYLSTTDEEVRFTLYPAERDGLNEFSRERHGVPFSRLPFGSAATYLLHIAMQDSPEGTEVVDEQDRTIVATDMDGAEAVRNLLRKQMENVAQQMIRRGRIIVDVLAGNPDQPGEDIVATTFEYTTQAGRDEAAAS